MIDDAGRSLIAFMHSSHILAITRPFLQLSKGVMQTRTFTVLSKHLIQGPRMLDANHFVSSSLQNFYEIRRDEISWMKHVKTYDDNRKF